MNENTSQVVLWSSSLGLGIGYGISFGRAPFRADSREMADRINALPGVREWLYYPHELGAALLQHGISSRIYGHSGKAYVDGIAE